VIKYLGSKRLLIPKIVEIVKSLPDVKSILDLFSGTSRVGQAFRKEGFHVISNDHNEYAHVLAKCYIQASNEDKEAEKIIEHLNKLPGKKGYFTETFCNQSRFFHPKNGERVDAVRDEIASMNLAPDLEAVLLTSLIEAADRVDSTVGVQMAYLKQYAKRAHNDLELRMPDLVDGICGKAVCMEAVDAAKEYEVDLVYLDPPYNQHSYLGNYHIWETLVKWDKPEVYGVACKRVDVRERKSAFNSKVKAKQALSEVVDASRAKYLLLSFNDEGHLSQEDIEEILGPSEVFEIEHSRYVGARIGIHNRAGEKVGEVSHIKNKERLFLAKTGLK
jgi:adenine-specific DNA-methyltransferase